MANPFSSYRLIKAEQIIKSNIRSNKTKDDLSDLIRSLSPLKLISSSNLPEGSSLNPDIVKTLAEKAKTLDLLEVLGYIHQNRDEYVYKSPKSDYEHERRLNGVNEFHRFFNDLKSAKNGTLNGFEEFIHKSLITTYNASAHSFIRRKLAISLFKLENPHSSKVGDNYIDQTIDQKIRHLKQHDNGIDVPRTDDVYIECLIRSNFSDNEALQMLRHNRPNLTQPTVQPVSNQSTKISITDSVQHLKEHRNLLNRYRNENNLAQQLLHDDDKMYRLLYCELSSIIGRQVPVKIETFASILYELSMEAIENLDIAAIKNTLRSSNDSQFSDNFRANAINSLSMACPICLISFPRSQMETMFLCDHICCLECLKIYYRNTINTIQDSKSLNKLTCFLEQHQITIDTKMNFFIYLEAKLTQWFHDEPDILKMYHDKIFYATRDKQTKKCGNSHCVSCFYIDDNNDIGRVVCPHCQFAQCRQCCRKWCPDHASLSCDQYAEWLIDNDPDDPNVQIFKYLSETGIACPNPACQLIFDYQAGGCEHFTCTECKTEFCRMCSALFYSPKKNVICPQANCKLKGTIHAHCTLNCFRETRIGQIDVIIKFLNEHNINVKKELHKKAVSTNNICPVEDCKEPASSIAENRFCANCYKQFLCSLIWRYEIEPWEIYEDNNLQQMLIKGSVIIPANATRQNLIEPNQQSTNANDMTLKIVDEFKHIVRNKVRQGHTITQPIVELEVAKIRREYDPDQYDVEELKKQLPRDLQNCSESILRVSMAYGNDPQQIESIIQSKMNSINLNDNVNSISLDNIIEPLIKLKKDLKENPLKDIFGAVRNINDRNTDRADRLFLSEVYHFTPAIRTYKFDDAHKAVEAIRSTTYELEKPEDLLPIIKTCQEVDEIRDHLNEKSKTSMKKNEPLTVTTTTSRFSHDDRHSSVPTGMNDRNRFNENRNPPSPRSAVQDLRHNFPPYSDRQVNRAADRWNDNRSQALHHDSVPNLHQEFLRNPGKKT
ncbi:unnamed protein product [Rotaria sp. Silwood2]|nr:unnamed protein product [Rotaria sp. Silwood2]